MRPADRRRLRVLFLCTGNSCRSQMAEGWARAIRADVLEPCSAGTSPGTLDPRAVRAMAEVGIDISGQTPKHPGQLDLRTIDVVVSVCDAAREACPFLPGALRHVHHPFDDPPALARVATSDDLAISHYRRVRDQIRQFIESCPDALLPKGTVHESLNQTD